VARRLAQASFRGWWREGTPDRPGADLCSATSSCLLLPTPRPSRGATTAQARQMSSTLIEA